MRFIRERKNEMLGESDPPMHLVLKVCIFLEKRLDLMSVGRLF